jgi:formylglycine-generating enzyme required for sulfatase activity
MLRAGLILLVCLLLPSSAFAAKRSAIEKKQMAGELLRPGMVFRDCFDCPELVVVPAGKFMMGSPPTEAGRREAEGPQHTVTIARPFAVGKYEVTFEEWDACVQAGGCKHIPDDDGWGRGKHPVIHVSWRDTKEYLAWLSLKTGQTYRLLSEAEWEYAARAGTTTRYAFGDTISKVHAQYSERYFGSGGKPIEVGLLAPNAFGLHDMHGNVWELVEDYWHPDYKGAPVDGSVWRGGDASQIVVRGGYYATLSAGVRSADRFTNYPDSRHSSTGFRLCRTI